VKRRKIFEKSIESVLLICACVSVLAIIFITIFIFVKGMPLFQDISLKDFLLNAKWNPTSESDPQYGIAAFIVGSVYVTAGALVIGVPFGLACAIYLAEIANTWMAKALKQVIELLAGIPSVIYGFFGLVVICPIVRELTDSSGLNIISASFVLAIMILPTIVNISEVSLRAVPLEYKEGSLALGASHWQTIVKVLFPAAKSGIIASIVLGTGRAVGETMAVLMVAGNAPQMPKALSDMVRTLTMNVITDMDYASGDHRVALFTTGIVLFVFIMILNMIITAITRKGTVKA
jgi:phosphate transport system permease protein